MAKATCKDETVAESAETVVVEGNHYFPAKDVKMTLLRKSGNTYVCPWKGRAEYYDVTVSGETVKDGAWSYPQPKEAAKEIAGRFAFWKGIRVD